MPIADNVKLGPQVSIPHPELVNLYGCSVGEGSRIGTFVEIQKNATVGARCKISSHSFVCEGVTIEAEVFVGHGVMFANDKHLRTTREDGSSQSADDWELLQTTVARRASIGTRAVILGGVRVGEGALPWVPAQSLLGTFPPALPLRAYQRERTTNAVDEA